MTARSRRRSNEQFVRNTQDVLDRLKLELGVVRDRRHANEVSLTLLRPQRTALLRTHLADLFPDLSPRTIARLKRLCPKFMTPKVVMAVADAHYISVPFWTWFWGKGSAFRAAVVAQTLSQLKTQLASWLDQQNPAPTFMKDVTEVDEQIRTTTADERELALSEGKLTTQIEQLENVLRTYSRANAPEPTSALREAIGNSADRMRTSSPITPAAEVHHHHHTSSGPSIFDYFILDSILHSGHHHDRSEGEGRSGGGYATSGGGSEFNRNEGSTAFAGRGGSSRLSIDEDTRDGGGGSTRLSVDQNERDGGGGSSRLAAAVLGGVHSDRLGALS